MDDESGDDEKDELTSLCIASSGKNCGLENIGGVYAPNPTLEPSHDADLSTERFVADL